MNKNKFIPGHVIEEYEFENLIDEHMFKFNLSTDDYNYSGFRYEFGLIGKAQRVNSKKGIGLKQNQKFDIYFVEDFEK